MKKLFAVVFILLLILFAFAACSPSGDNDNYLRIHIRANSNDDIDQNVKYIVKDQVVEYLTPLLAEAHTKEKAKSIVLSHKSDIEKIADNVLRRNGFSYSSEAHVTKEVFPTRSYLGFTLEAGEYEALILNLGTGEGNNWWCVVYPPLCFVGGELQEGGSITYKSKIMEIINSFFGK